MVIKKEDKVEEKKEINTEQSQGINIVTQIATAIQNLGHRVSALEIDSMKAVANEKLIDKQIAFLGDRIDFINEKTK